jgi:hypothetical protein
VAPLGVEQRRDLPDHGDPVLGDGLEALQRVEDVQEHRGDALVERGAEQLGGAAHVRGREVHQQPVVRPEVEPDGEPDVLDEDALVAEQRRLGRAGRAGGEDDEAPVALPDAGARTPHRAEELRPQVVELDPAGEVLHPGGAGEDAVRLLLELHPVAHAGELPDHLLEDRQQRGRADEEVALRPELLERGPELARAQPQVERGEDHADAVAGDEQEDVLLQQRQAGGDDVALAVARGEQPRRERVGGGVELLPGDELAGVVLEERDGPGRAARVLGDAIGDVLGEPRRAVAAGLVLGGGLHGGAF